MMREKSQRWLLIISLALNLFALGIAAGGGVMWSKLQHPAATPLRHPVLRAADGLPPDVKMRYRAELRQLAEEQRPMELARRADRRTASALFAQPNFDPVAVKAAMARTRNDEITVRAHLEDMLVAFAATLPQEQRQIFADALARGGPLRAPAGRAWMAPNPKSP